MKILFDAQQNFFFFALKNHEEKLVLYYIKLSNISPEIFHVILRYILNLFYIFNFIRKKKIKTLGINKYKDLPHQPCKNNMLKTKRMY